jgi:hypothetical protein
MKQKQVEGSSCEDNKTSTQEIAGWEQEVAGGRLNILRQDGDRRQKTDLEAVGA